MEFADQAPKLTRLLYGLIAFAVVLGGLLLVLDVVPTWVGNRRTRREVALLKADAPMPSRRKRKPREGWYALGFLFPAIALLTLGLIYPAIRTTVLSFMDRQGRVFVGLANYEWLFSQQEVIRVITNTLVWVLLVPTVATSIGLVYAVLVDKARMERLAKSLI